MKTWGWLLACASIALTAGCSADDEVSTCGGPKLDRPVLLLESDEGQASALARLEIDGCLVEEPEDLAYGGDSAAVATSDDHHLILNRQQALAFDIDPATFRLNKEIVGYPMGGEAMDLLDADRDASGALWLAFLQGPGLGVVDAKGTWERAIDLADSAVDPDGAPEAEAVRVNDGFAYVALEHLDDDYVPTHRGTIAVVDVATKASVDSFELSGENPLTTFRKVPSTDADYAICTAGDLHHMSADANSGIEIVTLARGHEAARLVVDEAALGGFCDDVIIAGDHEGYVIVAAYDGGNATSVISFDPMTGELGTSILSSAAYDFWSLALDGGLLLVGDRSPDHPRVVAIDRATKMQAGEIATSIVPLQLLTL